MVPECLRKVIVIHFGKCFPLQTTLWLALCLPFFSAIFLNFTCPPSPNIPMLICWHKVCGYMYVDIIGGNILKYSPRALVN